MKLISPQSLREDEINSPLSQYSPKVHTKSKDRIGIIAFVVSSLVVIVFYASKFNKLLQDPLLIVGIPFLWFWMFFIFDRLLLWINDSFFSSSFEKKQKRNC